MDRNEQVREFINLQICYNKCLLFMTQVDDAQNSDDLKTLLQRVNDDKDKSFCDFELNLKSDDLNAAKSSLILLRYYSSLETSIKNKLSKLGVVEQLI